MQIKKKEGSYSDYTLNLSWGQLLAIRNALATDHTDPVSDELHAELNFYLANLPGPGESEEDIKKAEEADDSGLASPEAEGQPLKPSADDLLPLPGHEGGEGGEGEAEPGGAEGQGEEGPPGPPEPPEGAEDMPPPNEKAGKESEADRRLPTPPRE